MARVIPDLLSSDGIAPDDSDVSGGSPAASAAIVFDADAFQASVGGSRETLLEVLGITLKEDVPRLREALGKAEISGDAESLEQAAHAIKGLAAELRAEPCRAAAAALEASKNAGDVPLLRSEFVKLEEALQKAIQGATADR